MCLDDVVSTTCAPTSGAYVAAARVRALVWVVVHRVVSVALAAAPLVRDTSSGYGGMH